MVDKLHRFRLMLSIIFISILFSCASIPQAPDEARLRLRVQILHNAICASDAKTWYEMSTPSYRRGETLEEFKKSRKIDEKSVPLRRDMKLEKICICAPISDQWGERLRCVLMVSITEPEPEGVQGVLFQNWEYFDHEWYFEGLGPIMDECRPLLR